MSDPWRKREFAPAASDLTRLECRVKLVREGKADLLKDYDDFFADAVAEIVALSQEIMDRAQRLTIAIFSLSYLHKYPCKFKMTLLICKDDLMATC
jgi:hypothetical protein